TGEGLVGPSEEFSGLLERAWPELTADQRSRVVHFFELVRAENEIQNLTRLITPQDFLEGHVLDVKELLSSGLLSFPAADIGSGGGVPGLLAAAIGGGEWVLIESEKRKAEFLSRAADALGLSQITVYAGRVEEFAKQNRVESY